MMWLVLGTLMIFVISVITLTTSKPNDVSIISSAFCVLFSFLMLMFGFLDYGCNFGTFNPQKYNSTIVGKHYEYQNVIYKVTIDTIATNKYIKDKFILEKK